MKHVKKLLAVVLSAALAMSMCVCAFATGEVTEPPTEESSKPTIQITNNTYQNVFSVYQLMAATEVEGNQGSFTYTRTALLNAFIAQSDTYSLTANNEIQKKDGTVVFGRNTSTTKTYESDTLTTKNNVPVADRTETSKLATAIAQFIRNANKDGVVYAATGTQTTEAKPYDPGFYLVLETTNNKAEDTKAAINKEVASKPILIDLRDENVTVDPKDDTTKLDKWIIESGDSDKEEVNNASIGDTVPYMIETKIPNYESDVDPNALSFVLTDTFAKGLTFKEITKIKVGDTVYNLPDDAFAANSETISNGKSGAYKHTAVDNDTAKSGDLVIQFATNFIYNHQGEAVTVWYSATLNENAKVNNVAGNVNKVKLEYAHNPGQSGSKKTLEDDTKTYTYGFQVKKVDKNNPNEVLKDAIFSLKEQGGTDDIVFKRTTTQDGEFVYTKVENPSELTATQIVTPEEYKDLSDEQKAAVVYTTAIVSQGGIKYPDVKGLDEGTYELTEEYPPDEFTVLTEPITITIVDTDETKETDNDKPNGTAAIYVGGEGGSSAASESGNTQNVTDKDGNTTGAVLSDGTGKIDLTITVPDVKGVTMPQTGARTAMYCMIGGAAIVVLGAGYYLMGARRNKKEQ